MGIALQILDGTHGQAAADVAARLERACAGGWAPAGAAETGSVGRIANLSEDRVDRGVYRLVIDSGAYFASLGMSGAYPEVVIVFRVQDDSGACQINISLSPYSFSAHFVTVPSRAEE